MYRLETTIFKSSGPTQIWRGEEVVYVAPGRLSVYQRDLDLYDTASSLDIIASLSDGVAIDTGAGDPGTPLSFHSSLCNYALIGYTLDGTNPTAVNGSLSHGVSLAQNAKILLGGLPGDTITVKAIAYTVFGTTPVLVNTYTIEPAVYVNSAAGTGIGSRATPFNAIQPAIDRAAILVAARNQKAIVRLAKSPGDYMDAAPWILPDGVDLSGNWQTDFSAQDKSMAASDYDLFVSTRLFGQSGSGGTSTNPRAALAVIGPGILGNAVDHLLILGPSGDDFPAALKVMNTGSRQILFDSVAMKGQSTVPGSAFGAYISGSDANTILRNCFIVGSSPPVATILPTTVTGLGLSNASPVVEGGSIQAGKSVASAAIGYGVDISGTGGSVTPVFRPSADGPLSVAGFGNSGSARSGGFNILYPGVTIQGCLVDGGFAVESCGIKLTPGSDNGSIIVEKTKVWGGDGSDRTDGVILSNGPTPLAANIVFRNNIIHGGIALPGKTTAIGYQSGPAGTGKLFLLNNTLYAVGVAGESVLILAMNSNAQIVNNLIISGATSMNGVYQFNPSYPGAFNRNAIIFPLIPGGVFFSQGGTPVPPATLTGASDPFYFNFTPTPPASMPISPPSPDPNWQTNKTVFLGSTFTAVLMGPFPQDGLLGAGVGGGPWAFNDDFDGTPRAPNWTIGAQEFD
jgi:hypothetical protein